MQLFLLVQALVFALFGLFALIRPAQMLGRMGVTISGGDGIYEMRGIYGGVSLAIALLCGLAAFDDSLTRPALILLVTYMGGYLFARIVGVFFDGLPSGKFFLFIFYEALTLLGALFFLGFILCGQSC